LANHFNCYSGNFNLLDKRLKLIGLATAKIRLLALII